MAYIDDLQKFRQAIRDGDVDRAWALAHTLQRSEPGSPLGLGDSRDLVVLLARAGDRRFDAAAARWLERIAPEHTELEMKLARLAIDGLKGPERQSHRCEQVLLALFSHPVAGTKKPPP